MSLSLLVLNLLKEEKDVKNWNPLPRPQHLPPPLLQGICGLHVLAQKAFPPRSLPQTKADPLAVCFHKPLCISFLSGPIVIDWSRISGPWHNWNLGSHKSLLWVCPVRRKMCSNIPDLYPLDAGDPLPCPSPGWQPKCLQTLPNIPRVL